MKRMEDETGNFRFGLHAEFYGRQDINIPEIEWTWFWKSHAFTGAATKFIPTPSGKGKLLYHVAAAVTPWLS
jgi:hypothetical protein